MIVDRFTKFILSIIAFSLCLIALNPWLSPTLANANDDFAMERAIKKISGGINKIADNIEKMVEIENDLFVYWPMMLGSENIVAMYADKQMKESLKTNQACGKGEKPE
jgi:hypothetical protein